MKKNLLKNSIYIIFATIAFVFACDGVDRSCEQPFSPTVETVDINVSSNTCSMVGTIVSSPNSEIISRGFYYGNDTINLRVLSSDSTSTFEADLDSLELGEYYGAAFAINGIGESRGDTLYFTVD